MIGGLMLFPENSDQLAIGKHAVYLHNLEIKMSMLPKHSRNIPQLQMNCVRVRSFLERHGHDYKSPVK
ncbi:MAG: hypothetical protein Q7T51_02330 [Candidatus Moranbacteria bacterium]|nr:hypothetical protein [Candidatus Moranbacteria bacterium]